MANNSCNNGLCLDKPEQTKISMGNKILSLSEFDGIISINDRVKKKIDMIDEELKKY